MFCKLIPPERLKEFQPSNIVLCPKEQKHISCFFLLKNTIKMNKNNEAGCPNCKNPMESSAKFCSKCGTGVECQRTTVKCPTCSALLEGGVNVCPHCGSTISSKRVPGSGEHPQKPPKPAFATSSKRCDDKNLVTPKRFHYYSIAVSNSLLGRCYKSCEMLDGGIGSNFRPYVALR